MKNKLLMICLLCLLLFTLAFSVEIKATENLQLTTDAKSAVLIEPTTMTVIYSSNPYEKLEPASLTKIMTMLLTAEAISNGVLTLEQKLVASKYATSMGGTQIYLEEGEAMTVNDLLKSVAIASANDASIVLAEGISGSTENFVKKMNEKGKELGLTNTVFKNPNGLPEDGHYSCAMDMAIMSAHLVSKYGDIILPYTSKYEDYVREDTTKRFWLVNRNKLVKQVEGVDGLKTGWTTNAGYCISATIKKDNIRFVSVVMNCSTPDNRMKESLAMLNYGLANYELVTLYHEGDVIKTYRDINYVPKIYNIVVGSDICVLRKKGESIGSVTLQEELDYSLITSGKAGKLKVFINNKLYKECELEVLEQVHKASFFDILLEVIKEIFLVTK